MLGSHCIKHSSNLQSTVSLSSGESEFYALVKAGVRWTWPEDDDE